MIHWAWLIVALIIGANIGYFVASLCFAAKRK